MIRTRNLSKRLGRREVLQGLDLEIQGGQRVALIGSNGAGKTTLIRCLLGEYRHGGEVAVVGRDQHAGTGKPAGGPGPVAARLTPDNQLWTTRIGRYTNATRSAGGPLRRLFLFLKIRISSPAHILH